jgi:peptidoglycan/LPS O-acetylase OafA/YrhL
MTGPARTPPDADAGPRLLWLDALRGVAVLAVVVEHLSYFIFTGTRQVMLATADPGIFGVTLFFLISGFVVPASLERRGDPRRFWVSRFFRLYPLWAVAAGLALAIELAGRFPLPPGFARNPGGTLAANAMMLEGLLGPPHLIGVFWTLTYEMTFYLLLSALFVWGLHTFSAGMATVCAATALLAGGFLPARSLPLPWLAAVLIAAGLAGTLRRRRRVARAGAAVLTAALLALLAGNQPAHGWEGLIILGFMFTGTAIYRAGQRQVAPTTAVFAVVTVLGCAAVAAFRYGVWFPYGPLAARSWLLAVVAAFVTFGLGLALRHARVPRPLSWLGRVSYSVYLAHTGIILAMEPVIAAAARGSVLLQALGTGLYFVVLFICCQITHRLIETPGQALGRRLSRRLRPADARVPVQPVRAVVSPQTEGG